MAIDFSKLNDPVLMAERQAQREKESQELEEKDQQIRDMLNRCLDKIEEAPERERSFLRSCQRRTSMHLTLSEAQEKWLRDIASRA